jgi:adenosylcobinamide-GDP ribazoletransferase
LVLTALRGAVGFFTRLPVGRDAAAWEALRGRPAAVVLIGYPIGALLAVPFLVPVPAPVIAFGYLAWLVAVTGIAHADGLADLGDAVVVHGPPPTRRRVMRDTTVGVGGILAVALVVAGLVSAAWALAALPLPIAVSLVVASEVGAKLAMATLSCLGEPSHRGMAAGMIAPSGRGDLPVLLAVAVPAAALAWPTPAATAPVVVGLLVAASFWRWADRWLGGVGGDLLGAANEVGRVLALHAGVIAWTLW